MTLTSSRLDCNMLENSRVPYETGLRQAQSPPDRIATDLEGVELSFMA